MAEVPFWESKTLDEMSDAEWESLCDGCARCCLQKLEDSDTGEIYFTSIACRLLDCGSCRCSNYKNRQTEVPDCTMVRPITAEKLAWLPGSCAYKRLATGLPLPAWHPLITGDPDSVHDAAVSVKLWAIPEEGIKQIDYEEYVIDLESAEDEEPLFPHE